MNTTQSPYPYSPQARGNRAHVVYPQQGRSSTSWQPRAVLPQQTIQRPWVRPQPQAAARPARAASPVAWSGLPLPRSFGSMPWMAFAAAALLFSMILFSILAAGGFYLYRGSDYVYPGVAVGSISAGGLTRDELRQKLAAEWEQQPNLLLTDGQHSWSARPVDLGFRIDAAETAARAYAMGRGPDGITEVLWLARFQKSVDPVVAFDPQAARVGLEKLAGVVDQPAQDASLRLENGQWTAVPGHNGRALMVDAMLQQIAANPQPILAGTPIPLVTQTIAPRVSDLTPVLNQLRAALDRPIKLQAYDPITNQSIDWEAPREVFGSWVTFTQVEDQVQLSLDGQQLSAYLDQWKASLGPDRTLEPFTPPADLSERWQNGLPVTAIIRHNPTTYTVESGDTLTRIAFKVGMPYWKIQQANPGIDANHLSAGQTLTIPSKNEMLPLPIVLNKRIVVSISQQRMWTYENGSLRQEYVISTGIERSPTIPGIYQIRTHDPNAYASAWDLWMPNFMGIYEGWPGFMNGIHGLPTLSNGTRLWAGYLGRPISYGCIVMSLPDAEDVYNWAEEGVIIEIQP